MCGIRRVNANNFRVTKVASPYPLVAVLPGGPNLVLVTQKSVFLIKQNFQMLGTQSLVL